MKAHDITKNVEIINEIIAIEAAAQELVKNAELEQSELQSKIESILEAYETRNREIALDKIKYIRAAEEKTAKEKIARIHKDHDEKMAGLEKIIEENIDAWTERIYSSIITPTEI